jgi:hypothetical protein
LAKLWNNSYLNSEVNYFKKVSTMKAPILRLFFLVMIVQLSFGQQEQRGLNPPDKVFTAAEQELLNLSKDKWQWMADKNTDKLADLFHENLCLSTWADRGGKNRKSISLKAAESGIRKPIYTKQP